MIICLHSYLKNTSETLGYLYFVHNISESYREDYEHAKEFFSEKDDEQQFYINMKSGAESGWDYSTKW